MKKKIKVKEKIKKINKKLLQCSIVIFLFLNLFNISLAEDEIKANINYDIIESQKESLDMQGFVKEANKFTKDVFSDTDMGDVLNSAILGKVDNKKIFFSVWNLFGKEFTSCIIGASTIIVIIVIHSIIKSISDGLDNKSISRCNILCRIHINCNNYNK